MKRTDLLRANEQSAREFIDRCKAVRDLGISEQLVSDDVIRSLSEETVAEVIRTVKQVNNAIETQKLADALVAKAQGK